jgi:hypothetical protein
VRYIFVDNFRGFERTLLTIRDVNFLVGENSTGKTSILALIKLLGTSDFWFDQRFYIDEVKLGMFKDIVSVSSPNRSYFSIGLANIATRKDEKQHSDETSYALLCTFIEEEGSPIMIDCTIVTMGEHFRVHFGSKTAKYRHEGEYKLVDEPESIKNMFLTWADNHPTIGSGYKSVRMPFYRMRSLLFIHSYLEDIARKKKSVKESRRYPFYIKSPFEDIVWLAPIRTRPQRTYDAYRLDFSPEGEHTPYLIKKLLTRRTSEQRKQATKFIKFIEKFGRDSGLFRSISIKDYDRRTTTSPFELDIILAEKPLSVDNVGYGISQALPLIVELFWRPENTWFTIQQPEIHLHPMAQTALGDIIFELATLENKRFIIETHSDFTIDGFRLHYKGLNAKRRPDAQIVFFERKEGFNQLHEIAILDDGEISAAQPKAYREFFLKKQMQLLGLSNVHSH